MDRPTPHAVYENAGLPALFFKVDNRFRNRFLRRP